VVDRDGEVGRAALERLRNGLEHAHHGPEGVSSPPRLGPAALRQEIEPSLDFDIEK